MPLWRRIRHALAQRLARWVRRRQGEDALPLTVGRQRLYILPTRAGTGLGLLLLFMLLAGLNYGNNLALFATFLLMGFVLVGMHLCHRNLRGLRILAVATQPGFAGGQGRIELTLDTEDGAARWAIDATCDDASARLSKVDAQRSGRLELVIDTPRRGLQAVGRIALASTFPFGLFRTWTWLHLPLEIVVYPAPAGREPLPRARDGQDQGLEGGGHGSDEWQGMRAFRDGDSPRQVIWTAYARELPLLVKEYAGAAAEWFNFDFELLTPLDPERRLQQICRWVLDAEARGARYALALPGAALAADLGQAHRDRCLRALALFPAGRATP